MGCKIWRKGASGMLEVVPAHPPLRTETISTSKSSDKLRNQPSHQLVPAKQLTVIK
jgi:hypothetical protein